MRVSLFRFHRRQLDEEKEAEEEEEKKEMKLE